MAQKWSIRQRRRSREKSHRKNNMTDKQKNPWDVLEMQDKETIRLEWHNGHKGLGKYIADCFSKTECSILECPNGSNLTIEIAEEDLTPDLDDELTQYDLEDTEEVLAREPDMYMSTGELELIMIHMVKHGLLPVGSYVISVSW